MNLPIVVSIIAIVLNSATAVLPLDLHYHRTRPTSPTRRRSPS